MVQSLGSFSGFGFTSRCVLILFGIGIRGKIGGSDLLDNTNSFERSSKNNSVRFRKFVSALALALNYSE